MNAMIFAIKSNLLIVSKKLSLVPRDCNADSVCLFDYSFLGCIYRYLTSKCADFVSTNLVNSISANKHDWPTGADTIGKQILQSRKVQGKQLLRNSLLYALISGPFGLYIITLTCGWQMLHNNLWLLFIAIIMYDDNHRFLGIL